MHANVQSVDINQTGIPGSAVFIGIIFSSLLILSNLVSIKLVTVWDYTFPSGLIFFPLTYIFDDILTEVYGYKVSRRIIWAAFAANLIVSSGTLIATYFEPSPYWQHQQAFETIYRTAPRVFLASMISYFLGEFANSIILAKLKVKTEGRHLWARAMTSTGIGVGIDTVCFMHIAFLFVMPYYVLWDMIMITYLAKLSYELCAIPITYKVTNYLKKKDKVDYYDVNTNFNPFSLEI